MTLAPHARLSPALQVASEAQAWLPAGLTRRKILARWKNSTAVHRSWRRSPGRSRTRRRSSCCAGRRCRRRGRGLRRGGCRRRVDCVAVVFVPTCVAVVLAVLPVLVWIGTTVLV